MYGIIGNGETCAFISIFNSIDWLCIPKFDSPTFFAKALDSENGGSLFLSYEIGGHSVPFEAGKHRYLEDTNILETTSHVGYDIIRTIDFMPVGKHRLWRMMGISGPDPFRLTINMDPKPNYNRAQPDITVLENGVMIASQGQALSIVSTEKANIKRKKITFNVQPPTTIPLLITYGPTVSEVLKEMSKAVNFTKDYQNDLKHWRQFCSEATPAFELSPSLNYYYLRSLLVLKLLMYEDTGAILAAPTTSFPEIVGKEYNWDYRFCWVRDGAYSAEAFALAGLYKESKKILEFILHITNWEGKPYPYPLVSIYGDLKGTEERIIDSLVGFGNTRPVRIGNKAVEQKQTDMEGEVIHALYTFYKYSRDRDYLEKHFDTVKHIADYWQEKDAGIWEFRTDYMNYVHSKAMCWAALHYSAKLADILEKPGLSERWNDEAKNVKEDVIANGYSDRRRCFMRSYEDDSFDASVLGIPLVGMIPVGDPMIRSTMKTLNDRLGTGGLLKRFEEETGAFMLSSLWYAQVLIKYGRPVTALDIINRSANYASSELGLFAEEYDAYYRRLVGNIPQSFSHEEFVKSVLHLLGKE